MEFKARGWTPISLRRAISTFCHPVKINETLDLGQPVDRSHHGYIFMLKSMFDYKNCLVFSLYGDIPYNKDPKFWEIVTDPIAVQKWTVHGYSDDRSL